MKKPFNFEKKNRIILMKNPLLFHLKMVALDLTTKILRHRLLINTAGHAEI